MRPAIVVVTGPTGVGKTQVALELARQLEGELVGADSVQVYRGFDIGSSKPTLAELGGIQHHLIDIIEPDDAIDAARYAALADDAIDEIAARRRVPIVVGGTGLWLRALLRGLVVVPARDVALRARLEREWDEVGMLGMHMRLSQVDPISAARIHANDKLRVVRALEVYEQSGQPLGELRVQHALGSPRFPAFTLVVDLPLAHHRQGLSTRVQEMVERGFEAEVADLLERHGSAPRALRSVGYAQMVERLNHGVPLDQTLTSIVQATAVYARRQRTWWRSAPDVSLRLTPDAALSDATLESLRRHLAVR